MRIRNSDGDWTFDRQHAFHVLGLDGTGALHRQRIHGVVVIARGGVWLHAEHSRRRRQT